MSNLVQVQGEQLPIETIKVNADRAINALKDKMIQDCTEDEVKSKLKLIYSMVGLRPNNYPQDQEKIDLHHYIFLKYGKKTLSEFVLAFDLAINNELDLSKDDVKVYDQFTIAYLASIMAAYKKWLYEQSKKVVFNKNTLVIEEKKEITDIEWNEWLDDMKKYSLELIPIGAYDYLIKNGKINPSVKEKKDCILKAIPIYIKSIEDDIRLTNEFISQKNEGVIEVKHKSHLINISKKILVKSFLENNE